LCLIIAVIFSKFLKPNAAEMLREREGEKNKIKGGKSYGKKERKKEREREK
jgi:hypothetical protein